MSSRLAWLLAAGALACSLLDCADSRKAEGTSETHFLSLCSDDSCGDGLQCVCGLCTEGCAADSTNCPALASGAHCTATDDGCAEPYRCDVDCERDADCSALSDAHRCQAGRCRAPDPSSGEPNQPSADSGSPPTGGQPSSGDPCGLDPMIERIANGAQLMECGKLGIDATSSERADAVACMGSAWQATIPFRLVWSLQGTDSALAQGYAGVRVDAEFVVYALRYDSAGSDPDGRISDWSPCALVRVPEGCADPGQCIVCEHRSAEQCACLRPAAATAGAIQCVGGALDGAIVSPPCASGSCLFDGICYPNGTTSEDGCCSCDSSGGSCIEPGWCPGWVSLGKRCSGDSDCSPTSHSSGLFCRSDFFGERGVCTRDCNFGCPTGYECVADVPDYNGGTVHNVCMRGCSSAADCMASTNGTALGSECDMPPGLTQSYCF